LSDFGRNKKQAKRSYQDFVEKEAAKAVENPYKQVTEGFLLGDGEFVKWVKETFLSGRNDEKEIPQLKKLKPRVAIDNVIQAVAEQYSCSADQIIAKGRKKNKAREGAIYLARDISGVSCKDSGTYFGGVSGALITIMHKRIAEESRRSRRFKRKINTIRKQIFNI
jgi:hypothetical protein